MNYGGILTLLTSNIMRQISIEMISSISLLIITI